MDRCKTSVLKLNLKVEYYEYEQKIINADNWLSSVQKQWNQVSALQAKLCQEANRETNKTEAYCGWLLWANDNI